jgi:hypothetical protein
MLTDDGLSLPASPALEKVAYVFGALGRRIAERRFDSANALTGGMNFHYDGEEAAHEVEVNAAEVATAARWTTHSDGTDNAVSCGSAVLAGIMDVINTAQSEGFSVQNVAT